MINMKKLITAVMLTATIATSSVTGAFANEATTNGNQQVTTYSTTTPQLFISFEKSVALNTSTWTKVVSDNNILNEKVTITHLGVPAPDTSQSILIKFDSTSVSTFLSNITLAIGDSTSFYIPFNGGKYTVWAKAASTNGSANISVFD
jgi:hypothetical protein